MLGPGNFRLDLSLSTGKKKTIESKETNIKTAKNMNVPDLLALELVEERNVMLSLFSRFKKSLVYVRKWFLVLRQKPFFLRRILAAF